MQANTQVKQEQGSGQFLTFYLGAEAYGVDILRVQEIRGWESVRSLPDAPKHVKGVLDLRGIIVPIIDLRLRFGNPEPRYESTTVVIIVAVGEGDASHLVGIVVDGVSDVLDAAETEIKPPPKLAGSIGQHYLHGMVSMAQGMVILVDIDSMLGEGDLADLEKLGT
jgi:purine-binding chemotaxis protein CheW